MTTETDHGQPIGADLLDELHRRVAHGFCMAGGCKRRRGYFICGEKYAANTFDDDRIVLYAVCARHIRDVAVYIGIEDGGRVPPEAICRDPVLAMMDLYDHAVGDGALVGFPDPHDWSVVEYLRSIPVC